MDGGKYPSLTEDIVWKSEGSELVEFNNGGGGGKEILGEGMLSMDCGGAWER